MRSLGVAVLIACSLFATALLCDTSQEARAQVSRPNPSATAQADKGVNGYAQPSPFPTCVAGKAFSFADSAGCIYDCAGGRMVRRSTSFAACGAIPTTGATSTATPTPTGSATPTATATA